MNGKKIWISKMIIISMIIFLSDCGNNVKDKTSSNSQNQSDKIASLKKEVDDLKNKQEEAEKEKEEKELNEYKGMYSKR